MQRMEAENRQEGDFNRQDEGNGRRGRRRGMGWDGDEDRADTRTAIGRRREGGHEDTRTAIGRTQGQVDTRTGRTRGPPLQRFDGMLVYEGLGKHKGRHYGWGKARTSSSIRSPCPYGQGYWVSGFQPFGERQIKIIHSPYNKAIGCCVFSFLSLFSSLWVNVRIWWQTYPINGRPQGIAPTGVRRYVRLRKMGKHKHYHHGWRRARTSSSATLTLPLRTRLLGVGLSALWGTANQNYP